MAERICLYVLCVRARFVLTSSSTPGSHDTTATIIHGVEKIWTGKVLYTSFNISRFYGNVAYSVSFVINKIQRRSATMPQYFVTLMQTRGDDGPEKNTKQTDRKSQQQQKPAAFSIPIGLDDTYYLCRRRRCAKHNKFLAPE